MVTWNFVSNVFVVKFLFRFSAANKFHPLFVVAVNCCFFMNTWSKVKWVAAVYRGWRTCLLQFQPAVLSNCKKCKEIEKGRTLCKREISIKIAKYCEKGWNSEQLKLTNNLLLWQCATLCPSAAFDFRSVSFHIDFLLCCILKFRFKLLLEHWSWIRTKGK